MVRALWLRAPFALRRYYALLAAIVACSALAAVTAAATPFVHAAVESESLRGELLAMSPLSAGLDVDVLAPGRLVGDPARRAALVRLTRSVPYVGRPILSSRVPVEARGGPADGLPLVAVARTGAVAHVRHLAATTGAGVWIADTTAHATGLRPGGQLRLASHGQPHTVVVRVKGIYAALAGDAGNPYWLNWLHEIRSLDPLAPDPAAFVLMSEPSPSQVTQGWPASLPVPLQ